MSLIGCVFGFLHMVCMVFDDRPAMKAGHLCFAAAWVAIVLTIAKAAIL